MRTCLRCCLPTCSLTHLLRRRRAAMRGRPRCSAAHPATSSRWGIVTFLPTYTYVVSPTHLETPRAGREDTYMCLHACCVFAYLFPACLPTTSVPPRAVGGGGDGVRTLSLRVDALPGGDQDICILYILTGASALLVTNVFLYIRLTSYLPY